MQGSEAVADLHTSVPFVLVQQCRHLHPHCMQKVYSYALLDGSAWQSCHSPIIQGRAVLTWNVEDLKAALAAIWMRSKMRQKNRGATMMQQFCLRSRSW